MYSEDQRRSPSFLDDRRFGHQRRMDQDEFYRRRPSPLRDLMDYGDRRFSPQRDGGEDGDRRRGGFREDFQSFQTRGRSPLSPPRLPRESLPPTPGPHQNQSHRPAEAGWRRDEPARSRARFRELSPDPRGEPGRERAKRNPQGPDRDRRRGDPTQDRNHAFKRQRRAMDDTEQLGYEDEEEEFGGQRYSLETPGGGFGGDRAPPRGGGRGSRPLVIEHAHGVEGRDPPRWKRARVGPEERDDRGGHGTDRQLSPRPGGFPQDRFRTLGARPDPREDARERRFQDSSYHDRRSPPPPPQDRPNPAKYASLTHRGRGRARPGRGRFIRGQGGRTGPPRNQPRPQGYRDPIHERQRPGFQPLREDRYQDQDQDETSWTQEDRIPPWEQEIPALLNLRIPRTQPDPKVSRQGGQGGRGRNQQKAKTMAAEETLTISVDMSRPLSKNSQTSYPSDRQLSLDLVNVGRQRLDFLPMLEHSGTYRESTVHTGTFAQEIITLVHQVKEQYFRGDGATLNERFSAPQKVDFTEEETEELTLDERFSSNRGFSLNMESLLDDEEPLFSRLGPMQGLNQPPTRGPGDLRHDLERRRQEKLEGVKVTIPGSSLSQRRPPGPPSEQSLDYSDKEDASQPEEDGFSWSPEGRRREGGTGPRRGVSYRLNTGSQRRNQRLLTRQHGPMRRQNQRAGPSW